MDRESGWGSRVTNRDCYSQWMALAFRLGMSSRYTEHVKTLRNWLQTDGPVPSTDRGGFRVAGPGPSNRDRSFDRSRSRNRDVSTTRRGRFHTRDDSPDRNRSQSRGRSLNRGSSGQFGQSKRSRYE